MKEYLLRRVGYMLIVLLGVTTVAFLLARLSGDPVALMMPEVTSAEALALLREQLGLDQPLIVQYTQFLSHAARGDFGRSYQYQRSASEVVMGTLAPTIQLAVVGLAVAVIVGMSTGVVAAVSKGTWVEAIAGSAALIGQCLPNFWLGLMMILFFGVKLRWFPISGRGGLAHLVMPGFVVGVPFAAQIARMVRSGLLDQLGQDYVRTARAKGLHETVVVLKHALRNAAIPVVTILGLDFGRLLGGAVIAETMFAWPGMGRLAVQAVFSRDFPVVQACVFIMGLTFALVNLGVDTLYLCLDPRIRRD